VRGKGQGKTYGIGEGGKRGPSIKEKKDEKALVEKSKESGLAHLKGRRGNM